MSHSPFQLEQFARLEALLNPSRDNPAALSIFGPTVTRGELRALDLGWILWGRPPLAFPDDVGDSVSEAELNDYAIKMRSTRDPKRRKIIALRARRAWVRLVERAEGLQVLGARYPSVVLFAS